MKYRFIGDHHQSHRVGKMADLLNVSRSGYYAWQGSPEGARVRRDRELTAEYEHDPAGGSPGVRQPAHDA